jgi:DNA-binding LacI/PurR family transcriptional regulator
MGTDDEQTAQRVRGSHRVTHADIARASGVSRATVSYVLNNVEGHAISEKTSALVRKTAKDLGHVPFAPARSLRLGRSNIVLALVKDFSLGYVSNRLLRALDVALAERGYVVLVHEFNESRRPLAELWGLVSPAMVAAMGGLSVPSESAIDDAGSKLFRVHGTIPHAQAGRMQVAHLVERGHRSIGYAFPTSPALRLVADERFEGVKLECAERGLPDPLVCEVDTDDPATIIRALDVWREHPEITAVAAHNDEVAIMVQSAMAARGLVAPRDLALIGIDNIPSARIGLTTIATDIDAWAASVVRSILALLEDDEEVPVTGDFLSLIVRSST